MTLGRARRFLRRIPRLQQSTSNMSSLSETLVISSATNRLSAEVLLKSSPTLPFGKAHNQKTIIQPDYIHT